METLLLNVLQIHLKQVLLKMLDERPAKMFQKKIVS